MSTPEQQQPPQFRDSINVPIAIPAWGALVLIAGAIYTAGIMVNKMDTLIDSSHKTDEIVATIREKQIGALRDLATLQAQTAQHDTRLNALEREGRRK